MPNFYNFSPMGDLYGDVNSASYNEEYERRKREAEARQAQEQARAQQAQEQQLAQQRQKQMVAQDQQEGYVSAPVQPTVAKPGMPQSYEQAVAQSESGNNPNIGYHDKSKSSAYGTFGITAPAYADVQKADPRFQGRDITTLTPDEQKQAMATYTGLNKQRLEGLGIPGTEGNLKAAHILGPGGLSQYLKDKSISPAALAANGGYGPLSQVVEKALKYGVSSAQAAQPQQGAVSPAQLPPAAPAQVTTTPAPVEDPNIKHWQAFGAAGQSDNPVMSYAAIAGDPNVPEHIRKVAVEEMTAQHKAQVADAKATSRLQKMAETGNYKDLPRFIKEEGEAGSRVLGSVFKLFGMRELADEQFSKAGAIKDTTGTSFQQGTDAAGNQIFYKQRSDGLPIMGYNAQTGEKVSAEQLAQVAGTQNMYGGKGFEAGVGSKFYGSDGRLYSPTNRGTYVDDQGRPKPNNVSIVSGYTAGTDPRLTAQNAAIKQGIQQIGKWYEVDPSKITPDAVNDLVTRLTPTGGDRAQTIRIIQADAIEKGADPKVVDQFVKSAGGAAGPTNKSGSLKEAEMNIEAQKKVKEQQARNTYQAEQIAPFVGQIRELIPQGTSSGLGAKVDEAAGFFGYSPEGATKNAAMAPLADKILKTVERFEGPQSDLDVKSYKEAAGRLSDPKVPIDQKQAAFETIVEILKRNAPGVNWDVELLPPKDREAKKWADAHPKDPRSAEINKRLGF